MAEQHRTYSWYEPDAGIAAARERPAIEVLRDMLAGRLPQAPIADTMGFELVAVDADRLVAHGTAALVVLGEG